MTPKDNSDLNQLVNTPNIEPKGQVLARASPHQQQRAQAQVIVTLFSYVTRLPIDMSSSKMTTQGSGDQMKPHYMCNKQECVAELMKFNQHPHSDLTVPELRVLLREMRKQAGLIPTSPGPTIMTEIKNAKRDDLRRMCSARDIPFTVKASVGELRLALRHFVINNATGETTMDIGKHGGATFQEVLHNHPSYCQWAVKEVKEKEEEASWQLIQFAKWVEKVGVEPDLWEESESFIPKDIQRPIAKSMNRPPSKEGAESSTRSDAYMHAAIETPTPGGEGYQGEMMNMMKSMMVEMHTMKAEMQELKETQNTSIKNRKTSGSPSFEMIHSSPQ